IGLNGGETCVAPRRIIATRQQYDALIVKLVERLKRLPRKRFSGRVHQRFRKLIDDAADGGATIAAGEIGPDGIVGPLLLTDVAPALEIFDTEIFAPIALVTPAKDVNDAVEIANRSSYGLGASIFAPPRAADAVAHRLDAGVVVINDAVAPLAHPGLPLAPRRGSGLGVTRGPEGLLEMTRPKAIVRSDAAKPLHFRTQNIGSDFFAAYIKAAHGRGLIARAAAAIAAIRALGRPATKEKDSCATTF
ncbi:MAG: aldehyde dehydrogenase family protein, partial [Gammaproteobacteria bacterium]|nr:aldehyde dehydrogenase family protein [Gammaproteobacteria bacterium]